MKMIIMIFALVEKHLYSILSRMQQTVPTTSQINAISERVVFAWFPVGIVEYIFHLYFINNNNKKNKWGRIKGFG